MKKVSRKHNKARRKIYARTIFAMFAVYLILMVGFSTLVFQQQLRMEALRFQSSAEVAAKNVAMILHDNIDSKNHITDNVKVKTELVKSLYPYPTSSMEIGVFSKDYNLIYNTDDYWLCVNTDPPYNDGYLASRDWFSEEVITELNTYLHAMPKAKKIGDLAGYVLDLRSFWMDGETVIPGKIAVVPMYAESFHSNGGVNRLYEKQEEAIVYTTNYQNTKNIPHYTHGFITSPGCSGEGPSKLLRTMVKDKNKLQQSVQQGIFTSYGKVKQWIYRYYYIIPYDNVKISNNFSYSNNEFWIVAGTEENILIRSIGILGAIWLSCFIVFMVVAFILSRQTYKVFREKEEFDIYRSETTSALAHDLKTPLSIISGYAQNLLENVHTEKREYYAGNIAVNVDRMDRIIKEMLDLSKYETATFQLNYEPVSLEQVCTKLQQRYNPICNERHITVELVGEATIKADYILMERVIDNFFVNALDIMPDGGLIKITISNYLLEFYNSGSFIPEEIISEVWKPYKKADTARSNKKGSGLGLSIVSKILDMYRFAYGAKNAKGGVIFWFHW